jgi:hypothetical protein
MAVAQVDPGNKKPAQQNKPGPPSPPTQNVLVVNSAGQPVPTAPQGTTNVAGTVNIGNTPNVNIANMPSVNVANTPSVSIAGTPTVNLAPGGSTNVTNPLDGQNNPNPLAVLEAIQPYEDGCSMKIFSTNEGSCTFQQIPAGKRLIIEEFDAYGFMDTGIKPIQLTLNPAGFVTHNFPATFMGTVAAISSDNFATHQATRIYAPPTAQPKCGVVLSNSPTGATYFCALAGFLVDVQ